MKNAELQKEWATQQCRERKAAADAEREEEKAFSNQEEAINRMRGMLDDENAQRKAEYQRQIMLENKRMAQEKREREAAWRDDQERNNQAETTLTVHPEELRADGTIRRQMMWASWRPGSPLWGLRTGNG